MCFWASANGNSAVLVARAAKLRALVANGKQAVVKGVAVAPLPLRLGPEADNSLADSFDSSGRKVLVEHTPTRQ